MIDRPSHLRCLDPTLPRPGHPRPGFDNCLTDPGGESLHVRSLQGSLAGPQTAFLARPRQARPLIFQALLIAAVIAFLLYIIGNTQANLAARGITTGFGFLERTAGFGIGQTLIEYSSQSTYGRTFVVGLLNTLLVSALGIVAATIIGFIVGIARLSPNWLIARLASGYIEIFRNIPLLLQIFFWYFAVLRAMPGPRDSLAFGEVIFLNVRGLFLPEPLFESGFGLIPLAFGIAVVASIALTIWNKRRHEATGKHACLRAGSRWP